MKKMFFMLFAICVAVAACKNNEPELENIWVHERTTLIDCNNEMDLETERESNNNISVYVSTSGAIMVSVNLFYICAAPFETKVETVNGVIVMSIIDTCRIGYEYCYARCSYYTFDFVFEREIGTELNQKYKIVLIDPRENEPIIISEGVITAD